METDFCWKPCQECSLQIGCVLYGILKWRLETIDCMWLITMWQMCGPTTTISGSTVKTILWLGVLCPHWFTIISNQLARFEFQPSPAQVTLSRARGHQLSNGLLSQWFSKITEIMLSNKQQGEDSLFALDGLIAALVLDLNQIGLN